MKFKKIIAGLTAAEMCIASMSLPEMTDTISYIFAEDTDETGLITGIEIKTIEEGKLGNDINYVLYETGDMYISGSGFMGDFSAPAITNADKVKNVIFEDKDKGILSIGANIFAGCSNLEFLELPGGLESIGECAFKDCSSLTSIFVPVTTENIDKFAFEGCISLTDVSIAGIKSMAPDGYKGAGRGIFSGCYNLKTLTMPAVVTGLYDDENGEEKEIKYLDMFFTGTEDMSLYSLEIINITSGNNITACAFKDLSMLKEVTLPETITSIGSEAFSGCSALDTLNLMDCTELKTIYSYAFKDCKSFLEFNIPSSVENIAEGAFKGCTGIQNLIIPENVVNIDSYAFEGCTGITEATIGSGIKSMALDGNLGIKKGVFSGCYNLEILNMPSILTGIYDDENGKSNEIKYLDLLYTGKEELSKYKLETINITNGTSISYCAFKGLNMVKNIVLPEYVTEIEPDAFSGCTALNSLTMPSTIKKIGSYAFENCTGLLEFDFPYSVENIGEGAFKGCTGIKNLIIPENVVSIDSYAFEGCTGITEATIGSGIKSMAIDGSLGIKKGVFSGCYNLEVLNMPSIFTGIYNDENGESKEIKYLDLLYTGKEKISKYKLKTINITSGNNITACAFKNLDMITEVVLPESIVNISSEAFSGCSSLTALDIENVKVIGEYAFENCTGFTKFNITSAVETISKGAFKVCTGLTEIIIPDSVQNIEARAFEGCSGLKRAIIGNGISSMATENYKGIKPEAFSGCYNLTDLYMPAIKTGVYMENGKEAELKYLDLFGSKDNMDKYSLNRIVITSGNMITERAFKDLYMITELELPDSISKIFDMAFENCTGLKDIYYAGTKEDWTKIVVGEKNDAIKTATIHFGNGEISVPSIKPSKGSGDVNKDGSTDLTDLTSLALYLLKDIEFTDEQLLEADVTGDTKVDLADLASLKMKIS